ncbi:MAG: hypothetical protein IB618_00350 [Candidatus Pacearchaeota archaeon]|nr:MAG: hypothetical protein IB618_00350 [Candidatus Pacearchaeota archaeon]
MEDNAIKRVYKSRRIVVHPDVVDRSRNCGIGRSLCMNVSTREISELYDLGKIVRTEKEKQYFFNKDPASQFCKDFFELMILYEITKKKIKKYFEKLNFKKTKNEKTNI